MRRDWEFANVGCRSFVLQLRDRERFRMLARLTLAVGHNGPGWDAPSRAEPGAKALRLRREQAG